MRCQHLGNYNRCSRGSGYHYESINIGRLLCFGLYAFCFLPWTLVQLCKRLYPLSMKCKFPSTDNALNECMSLNGCLSSKWMSLLLRIFGKYLSRQNCCNQISSLSVISRVYQLVRKLVKLTQSSNLRVNLPTLRLRHFLLVVVLASIQVCQSISQGKGVLVALSAVVFEGKRFFKFFTQKKLPVEYLQLTQYRTIQ